jgi:sugar O-acyltransferase (sialic acid O-acetyltransferase NeuD family)
MKIIIFGNRDMAELTCFYFKNDSQYQPVAFCVDGVYIKESLFCGLPVIPFEEIEKTHSSYDHKFHASLYASDMNVLRQKTSDKIERKGYQFVSYISSKAYTWNANIGKNAFILEGCNIQPFCKVGDNFMMWSFSHIGHHSVVGNHVFMSGNVVVAGHNNIGDNCFLGTNTITRDNISIAERTFIGQGSSVVKTIAEKNGFWFGSPAKKIKNNDDFVL